MFVSIATQCLLCVHYANVECTSEATSLFSPTSNHINFGSHEGNWNAVLPWLIFTVNHDYAVRIRSCKLLWYLLQCTTLAEVTCGFVSILTICLCLVGWHWDFFQIAIPAHNVEERPCRVLEIMFWFTDENENDKKSNIEFATTWLI